MSVTMNEKKMARNAFPWSSRPTLGPTASVRTIEYCPAPMPCASAESTATAVAWVDPSAVTPPVPSRVERRPQPVGTDRLRRLHLDQGAARELDRIVQAVHEEERESRDDDERRQAVGPAAPLDEIVVGVGEEADHVRRSEWPCPAGAAARSCRRFARRTRR